MIKTEQNYYNPKKKMKKKQNRKYYNPKKYKNRTKVL